jgi:hypothetical protein
MTVRNTLRIIGKVILFTLLSICVLAGSMYFLGRTLDYVMPMCFFGPIGPILILVVDVLWIIAMRKFQIEHKQQFTIKTVLSIVVFAVSVSLLFWWCFTFVFRQAMH